MVKVHHLNCGRMHAPPYPPAICHCLLLEDEAGLALVDTGLGLLDVRHPLERIGQPLLDLVGFQFHEDDTAIRQIESRGLSPARVRHVILTHADNDHVGGLADFPAARVHISAEELASVRDGHSRYLPQPFAHGPQWEPVPPCDLKWFGLPARPVPLGLSAEVLLIPLFGHTHGHCGVAIRQPRGWLLHAGDAYYLRVETVRDDDPVSQLATLRADDNAQRLDSLAQLRRLLRDHADEIEIFGYHDPHELPR